MSALVSVVIPCFNSEATISRAIESCLRQTYKFIEVVVVDDASEDRSAQVVSKIAEGDSRVKLYVLPTNRGVSHARNVGIELSSGLYFSTLDSDDYYAEDKIRAEVLLLTSGRYVAAFSNTVVIDERSKVLNVKEFPSVISRKDVLCRRFIPRDLLVHKDVLVLWSLKYDAALSLYEDWDWKLKLSSLGLMVNSNTVGTYYVKHDKGLSSVGLVRILIGLSKVFFKNSNVVDFLKFRYFLMIFNAFLRR